MDDLTARVEALERQMAAVRNEFKAAAHELRIDGEFMGPVSRTVADNVAAHWFDKAARRLLVFVLGVFGAAGVGLALFLAGKGFR